MALHVYMSAHANSDPNLSKRVLGLPMISVLILTAHIQEIQYLVAPAKLQTVLEYGTQNNLFKLEKGSVYLKE